MNKANGRHAEDQSSLHFELQQVFGQYTSRINSWHPSAVPSHQPSPIVPLGSSADNLNHWPSQIHHYGFVQNHSAVSKCHPSQIPVSAGFAPINGPTTLPRVTPVPFVQPRLHSKESQRIVQKSALSVLTYSGLPSSRVDKRYRCSKANTPLIKTTVVQGGRWVGPTPANLRKAVSQPSRSSQPRDVEAILPAERKLAPCIVSNKDDLIHLPAPTPTSTYLGNAHTIPSLLSSPQRLLLVLDLNGTLIYRLRASQNYTPRPCLSKFLEYAFANHSLLVWSSARPDNVRGICSRLFSPAQRDKLLGEWGRDTLGLTSAQYKAHSQVYKRLDRIWGNGKFQYSHHDFKAGKRWGQHNTLLIDGILFPNIYCILSC